MDTSITTDLEAERDALRAEVEAARVELSNLSEPAVKLKAWIDAARSLALDCGLSEDELRTFA